MPLGRMTPKATAGGSPSSKRQQVPPWFRTLKPSHAKVFSWDSDLVREARREFLLKHSYNFTTDSTCNLSKISQQMATSASLLGTSIHEIQASWAGPKELKKVNYGLQSLPQRSEVSSCSTPFGISQGYGTGGDIWPGCPSPLQWHNLLPLVQKGGPELGNHGQSPLNHALQARPGVQQVS